MKLAKRISFSEFSCYLTCPHKWYLNYYLKLPSGDSEELVFGSALHSTIESLYGNPKLKSMLRFNPDDTIKNIFKGFLKDEITKIKDIAFLENFAKKELAQIFMFQTLKMLKRLDFHKRFAEYEIVEFETKLEGVDLFEDEEVKLTFKGFIDLVLKHKETGRYLILDWKSSGKPWDIDKKEKDNPYHYAQLILYKHFYSLVKGIDFDLIDTSFYNLPRTDSEKQDFYKTDITRKEADGFLDFFISTTKKLTLHSVTLKEFEKIKFVTKKNYCYNCVYNKPELCSDSEQYQTVTLLS